MVMISSIVIVIIILILLIVKSLLSSYVELQKLKLQEQVELPCFAVAAAAAAVVDEENYPTNNNTKMEQPTQQQEPVNDTWTTTKPENASSSSSTSTSASTIESHVINKKKIQDGDNHNNADRNHETIHVLLALSGNAQGMLHEFEMVLKSLLLNAPNHSSMTVHIMTDAKAYQGTNKLLLNDRIQITSWVSIQPIQIIIYDCSSRMNQWSKQVQSIYQNSYIPIKDQYILSRKMFKHTIGTWFRLFVHEVIDDRDDEKIQQILYVDTDVIMLTNVQELWNVLDFTKSLHWGRSQCAGFMVLNVQSLSNMWKVVTNAYQTKLKELRQQQGLYLDNADQSFLQVYQYERSEQVQTLPNAWDNSIAAGLYKSRSTLVQDRPEIGYLHFNGGGQSKQAWFLSSSSSSSSSSNNNKNNNGTDTSSSNKIPQKYYSSWMTDPILHETFGLVDYYIRISWEWAKYFTISKIPNHHNDHHPRYNLTVHQIIVPPSRSS